MNKKRALEIAAAGIAAVALAGSGFWFGWTQGTNHPKNIIVQGATNISSTVADAPADFSVFWQAWQDINDFYLRTPSTTNETKLQGSVAGLINSLGDPYSEYFSPQDNQQFQQNITGDFGGIGAELGANNQGIVVVISPIKGTPAERAGLKPEDQIIAVNGTSTEGMTVDQVVNMIRGPENTPVTLSIMRQGFTKPQDFKIVRTNIQVPTVDFEMKGNVAHISLHEFTQDANELFYQALVKAVNANAQGIVLDLRDDPGGYLEVAVNLAGYFLKPNTLVVKEVGRTVPEQDFKSTGDGALSNMPLVVLVNGGSASASEILAGALHDDRGVKLVGEKSFGKGTVQELEQLPDGSAIKLTVAHWVMPSGRILDHDGLVPDFPVTISDAQIKAGQDPQLAKALSVVQGEIAAPSK